MANHVDGLVMDLSFLSSTSRTDMSKLFDRCSFIFGLPFWYLKLSLGLVSVSHLWISIAEVDNDDSIAIISAFVGCRIFDELWLEVDGNSDALLLLRLGIGAKVVPIKSENRLLLAIIFCFVDISASSSVGVSETISLLVFHIFILTFRDSTISSMISSCKLWTLPLDSVDVGGHAIDSLLFGSILPGAGNAATDSRLVRPKIVCGSLLIVTTECLLPPAVDCGAVVSVARNSACLGPGPAVSPRSDRRLT